MLPSAPLTATAGHCRRAENRARLPLQHEEAMVSQPHALSDRATSRGDRVTSASSVEVEVAAITPVFVGHNVALDLAFFGAARPLASISAYVGAPGTADRLYRRWLESDSLPTS